MKNTRRGTLRPTSSLVRNALFNILGDVSGLLFIDLFAGSGTVGLEAERRGAIVIFVEKDRRRADAIRSRAKGKVYTMDAIRFLRRLEPSADLIFADPPYSYRSYDALIREAMGSLREGGVFVLEHCKGLKFDADRRKVYGDTVLSIWER